MINFEIISIESRYLYVKLTLKTIKEEDKELLNRKIKFYYLVGNNLLPLDSTSFYTKYLPDEFTYEDSLLVNGQLIRFNIEDPNLRDGVQTRIIAIDEASLSIKYKSDPILLKTKDVSSLQFDIKNYYDAGFKSKVTLNMSELEEESIIKEHRLEQHIETLGIGVDRLSTKTNVLLNKREFLLEHTGIKEYGSYKITTKILNNKNQAVLTSVDYYSKQIEPLDLVCKMDVPSKDNFIARKPIKIVVKQQDALPRVTKIKINM